MDILSLILFGLFLFLTKIFACPATKRNERKGSELCSWGSYCHLQSEHDKKEYYLGKNQPPKPVPGLNPEPGRNQPPRPGSGSMKGPGKNQPPSQVTGSIPIRGQNQPPMPVLGSMRGPGLNQPPRPMPILGPG